MARITATTTSLVAGQTLPTAMKTADANAISFPRKIARIIWVFPPVVPETAFPSQTPGLLPVTMAAIEISNIMGLGITKYGL